MSIRPSTPLRALHGIICLAASTTARRVQDTIRLPDFVELKMSRAPSCLAFMEELHRPFEGRLSESFCSASNRLTNLSNILTDLDCSDFI